jgi:hypothetical protein
MRSASFCASDSDIGEVTRHKPERATPAALDRLLKLEIERWGRIIKDAGIAVQCTPSGVFELFYFVVTNAL